MHNTLKIYKLASETHEIKQNQSLILSYTSFRCPKHPKISTISGISLLHSSQNT
ncbi:hypothetical protein Hanom_Chr10g00876741 [Helianthus anomalus]